LQIGILEAKDFSLNVVKTLKEIGNVELYYNQALNIFLEDKEIIFIRLKYFIDKNFLDDTKNLQYICTPTTGLNHIDLIECKNRNIKVVSLKGEYSFLSTIRATPEHTFGLVLALLRNYKFAFLNKDNKEWNRDKYKGIELYNNNVGIIGFGRVGKILSKYFNTFSSNVYFYDDDDSIEEIFDVKKLDSIEELIEKSEIIILSVSYRKNNYEYFSKKYIDLLKSKYFINTSRGELIDEKYLIKKIEENFFAGIALDVLQNEQSNNNLTKMIQLTENRNFIITPHISGATYSSMHRTEWFIVKKLINILGKDI